jgi:hypothetical protein
MIRNSEELLKEKKEKEQKLLSNLWLGLDNN